MISRRRFLQAAVIVSAAATAAYIAKPQLRKQLLPELDTTYPLGVLPDEDMRNIVALGETLVAPESVPPVDFFHDYVNAVTQSERGLLKEYECASELLNRSSAGLFVQGAARQQFAELPLSRRDKVLQALLWQYSGSDRIVPKVEKLAASRDALALRMYIMGPLIEHYYRSPYGWAVVGYESFPGRPPLDPKAYTRPIGDKGVAS
jgi:hypothetical protein